MASLVVVASFVVEPSAVVPVAVIVGFGVLVLPGEDPLEDSLFYNLAW